MAEKLLFFPLDMRRSEPLWYGGGFFGPDDISGDGGALSAHATVAGCWEEEMEALVTAEERGVTDTWPQSYSSVGEEPVWPLWLQSAPLPLCKPPWKREMTKTHLSLPASLSFIHFLSANVRDFKYNLQRFQPVVHKVSEYTRWMKMTKWLGEFKFIKGLKIMSYFMRKLWCINAAVRACVK